MCATIKILRSQSEVARFANISQPRFIGLVKSGKITPDFRQGKMLLFTDENSEAIKKEFSNAN